MEACAGRDGGEGRLGRLSGREIVCVTGAGAGSGAGGVEASVKGAGADEVGGGAAELDGGAA